MTREAASPEPNQNVVRDAVRAAMLSPCRSKRGAVVFSGDAVFTSGCNHQVPPFTCDGSAACKAVCGQTAIHAEQVALLGVGAHVRGFDLLHVKVVDGALVPSGPPSCVQCSKLAVANGIAGVWLYHATGWRRYAVQDFHQLSVANTRPSVSPEPNGETRIAQIKARLHTRYDLMVGFGSGPMIPSMTNRPMSAVTLEDVAWLLAEVDRLSTALKEAQQERDAAKADESETEAVAHAAIRDLQRQRDEARAQLSTLSASHARIVQALEADLVAARREIDRLKAVHEYALVDAQVDGHGDGQEHTIADVNAGLCDDYIAPRLERVREESAANIDALCREVDGLRQAREADNARWLAELSTLRAALREMADHDGNSHDWIDKL